MTRSRPLGAFTLMELVVVLGLMAVLAAMAGLMAGPRESDDGVRIAQPLATAWLDRARAESESRGQRVSLVVNVDPESAGFLRTCWLARERDGEAEHWDSLDAGQSLPDGVRIVPGGGVSGCHWADGAEIAAVDGTALLMLPAGAFSDSDATGGSHFARVAFAYADGRPDSPVDSAGVVIGGAVANSQGLQFRHPHATVRLWVSRYGVTVPVAGTLAPNPS